MPSNLTPEQRKRLKDLWELGPEGSEKQIARKAEEFEASSSMPPMKEEQGLEDADFVPAAIPVSPIGFSRKAISKIVKEGPKITNAVRRKLMEQWAKKSDVEKAAFKGEQDFIQKAAAQLEKLFAKKAPGGSGKAMPGSRPYETAKANRFLKERKKGERPADFDELGSDRVLQKADRVIQKKAAPEKLVYKDGKITKVKNDE